MTSVEKTNIKIIIADDHDVFRKHIKNLIIHKNLAEKIDEAVNGIELIKNLEKNKYDIVLLDISMPEMDGLAALEVIKERFPDLKILVLTMHYEDSYKKRVKEKGADGFILKTQIFDNIFKAIEAIMSGKKYFIDS
ncbi:MAG: response regulator transcription factor [Spirochaetia bacterium]|nr:response regulator transcription factor [Spirochaetia bacterium]